jgi:transcriptional regulator with PAS, ATPase and Fis domain
MPARTPVPAAPPARFAALISFLEHDPAPMIVLDLDYNIVAANAAYLRQFGAAGRAYRGQKCYRVSHQYSVPCDQAGEHCPMKAALASRVPDRVLHIHHTPRGPEHVDVELRPVLGEDGAVIAYVERLAAVRGASAQPRHEGLVGRSETFNIALAALHRAAPSQIPVLLQGESGTGKELFARALHLASARSAGPLVVVDCTGLSESLFESELFGHERGAFTGAATRKVGLAETAHGGTLFLDEIGDVPLPMQVKLLRLIESGTFRRVGGVETLRADFRLVAATHKPLRAMVDQDQFRQDLYYRISAFPIHLPALRDRAEDIPLIAESLLSRMDGSATLRIAPEAMQALKLYHFPGNVRELRNLLERARLFADNGQIRRRDLPPELQGATRIATPARHGHRHQNDEKARLSHALAVFEGTRAQLAAHLGLSERTLYRRLKAHDLE